MRAVEFGLVVERRALIIVRVAQGLQLSQKMALQQVLAPQLQQSLALLQAPMLELKALVEQELQQNPVLEEVAETETDEKRSRDGEEAADKVDPTEPPADVKYDPATEKASRTDDNFQVEFERLAQMDQEWRDYFAQTNVPMRAREDEEERRQYLIDSLVAGTSLQEHMLEQVRLSELPETQRPAAEVIIGNLDDHGYLRATVDELAFSSNIPAEHILEVLKVVQSFHPPGVGARDLRECLLLQLERAGRQQSLEYEIIDHHLEALGKRRFPDIARALGRGVEEIQQAWERISHLEPHPGRDFLPDDNLYVSAEVFVRRAEWDEFGADFLPYDLTNPRSLAEKLSQPSDPVSKALSDTMPPALRSQCSLYAQTSQGEEELRKLLVAFLDRVIAGPCIYEPSRFAFVILFQETLSALKAYQKTAAGPNTGPKAHERLSGVVLENACPAEPRDTEAGLVALNRLLLLDAYPTELSRHRYQVSTTSDAIPHLRISNTYKDLMAQPNSTQEVRDYIRDRIRAGKFLIKSLQQRQQTILNIGQEIVNRQREFMDKGVARLKPMTMAQIADAVGVHETTVSRAVSGKYIDTPQGVFEMKYFFTSGLPTTSGVGVSNASVKDLIHEMISGEDKTKPWSDEEIVKRLREKGIMIARRTVAKYRSELNILPSHLRKVY